jgi:hypothetical protein
MYKEEIYNSVRKAIRRVIRITPKHEVAAYRGPDVCDMGSELSFTLPLRRARNLLRKQMSIYTNYVAPLLSTAQMYTLPVFDSTETTIERGHARVDAMRADALLFDPPPQPFQLKIIEFMIELGAPRIYGEVWNTDYHSIKMRNGWTKKNYGIGGILSARKEGKSTGVAMGILVYLMNIPHYVWAVFAPGLTQSQIMLDLCILLLRRHPKAVQFYIPPTSARRLRIIKDQTDIRQVTAHTGQDEVKKNTSYKNFIYQMLLLFFCLSL